MQEMYSSSRVMSMGASRTLDGYAMAQAAGLDPKTDVEWLPVGFGVQAALALKRGDVQALALWDLTYADMEANGIPLRYFTFPFQENIFGYVYVSTDDKLKTRRAEIIKVLRAGAKSQVFQAANMDAAACAYLIESGRWDTAPDKPKAFEAALAVVKQDTVRSPVPEQGQVGTFPAGASAPWPKGQRPAVSVDDDIWAPWFSVPPAAAVPAGGSYFPVWPRSLSEGRTCFH
jgi:ABC-type nitrate/sulfonate/bicarbonate transport system substrate-binding protein